MPETPSAPARVMIRMSRTLHKDLRELAEVEGVSLNQLIVGALSGLAARRAEIDARGDADAGAALIEIRDRVESEAVGLGQLSAQTREAEERLSALERHVAELGEKVEEIDADGDARLRDLEDEWYVGRENAFTKGLLTGGGVLDPEAQERRERLRERAEPRFDRFSAGP